MNKVYMASLGLMLMVMPGMLSADMVRAGHKQEENNAQPVQQRGVDTKMEEAKKSAQGDGIAFVDLQKIMPLEPHRLAVGSHEWKELYHELEKSLKKVDEELQDLDTRYKKGIEEFEQLRKSGLASQETMQKQVQEIGQLEMELKAQLQERGRFAQEEVAKASNVIGPKVEAFSKELCKEKGYKLILRKEVVLATGDMSLDETDEVISRLNKAYDAQKTAEDKKAQGEKSTES